MVSEKIEFINANNCMSHSIKNILQLIVVFTLLTCTGIIVATLRFVSFGKLVKFNRKYLMRWSSILMMAAVGIKLLLPEVKSINKSGYFITFNHNSYLDIFALTAIGLTNTVFILSEKTIKILPLTLAAYGIGVAYIPQKKHQKRRGLFFKNMEKRIKAGSINVAGASEGVHDHHHGIDVFNKGVYKMAINCQMKILPLFINVPKESNPFNKYKYFKRGSIQIEPLEVIDTKHWDAEKLTGHVNQTRDLYVQKFNAAHQTSIL